MGTLLIVLLAALSVVGQSLTPDPARPAPTQSADQTPTFSTSTSQVRLDVQVSNGKDLITGLKQEDFVVYDEDAIQPITYFSRDAEHVRLLLLLDISGSMKKNVLAMAATAKQALRSMRYKDRVGIMLFSRETKVREEFTPDMDEVARELQTSMDEDGMGAGTAINASILAACDYMRSYADKVMDPGQRQERRAILMATDNLSLNYKVPDDKVLRELYAGDIVFNAIVFGRAERPRPLPPGTYTNPDYSPSDVFYVAEQSGGEAEKAAHAADVFPQMMERIRSRYSISYKPPPSKAGTFRRVRVDLSPVARKMWPRAVLRYRNGYYSTGE